jgi:hypothetical protein
MFDLIYFKVHHSARRAMFIYVYRIQRDGVTCRPGCVVPAAVLSTSIATISLAPRQHHIERHGQHPRSRGIKA